jgi:hypothetical protein
METRWFRRLGPGVAALGAVAAIASTTAGAPPPAWDPPDCIGSPSAGGQPIGAWFRLDPTLVDGSYVGQRLTLGRADRATTWHLQLDAESFAAEPSGGTVLIGTDDGWASTLSLLDLAAGCGWPVGTSRDVVRGALVSPDGRAIVESRVDRRTRADLGIWRRPLDGGEPMRVLPEIQVDDRFGPTWVTQLDWADDGTSLVVGSCGQVACRYRVLPEAGGAMTTVADPILGTLVGMAEGRLIAHAACRGLPCPLISLDLAGGEQVVLDAASGRAVMARDEAGRRVVVHETVGGALRSVRPDGADARALPAAPDGLGLVAGPAWAASAAEHPADRLLFAPEGRLPLDGPRPALTRSISAADTVPLSEVTR